MRGRALSGARVSAAYYTVAILGVEVLAKMIAMADAAENGWAPRVQMGIYLAGLLAGVVFWWVYRPQAAPPPLFRSFLLLMALLWCVDVYRQMVSGEDVSAPLVAPPILLAMLWTKPPDFRGARAAVDAVAWIFMGAVVVSVALEAADVVGSWYDLLRAQAELAQLDTGEAAGATDLPPPGAQDRAYYWLPFSSVLGLDGRWAGPFFHPNHAGPVGAFLVVLGTCRTGVLRWSAIGVGIAALLLTSSRTSLLAAVAGCAVVASAWWLRRDSRLSGWAKGAVIVLPASLAAIAVVGDNWGFTGRTEIWPTYVDLWMESPLLGIPDLRIAQAADAGVLPTWAMTAHSLLLDSLVRFGILGTLVVLAALAVASVSAVRSAVRGAYLSIGLMAVILTCGITEALVFWRAFATSTILLVVAVIASLEEPDGGVDPRRPEPDAKVGAAGPGAPESHDVGT